MTTATRSLRQHETQFRQKTRKASFRSAANSVALTEAQLEDFRAKLATMTESEVIIEYKACHNACGHPDYRTPSPALIQHWSRPGRSYARERDSRNPRELTTFSKLHLISQAWSVSLKRNRVRGSSHCSGASSNACHGLMIKRNLTPRMMTSAVQCGRRSALPPKGLKNGRVVESSQCSYGHAAKVLDVASKVYIYYLRGTLSRRSAPNSTPSHCALDTPMMLGLGSARESIKEVDRDHYLFL